ncbi:MAG: Coenzyme F420 hydrogenase/dehydrogenase, beta subunit C-terminal domain [Eubacteriales bacterium]|nr:Coenzyme F420 hydrogenase/dehydrogenase, beta subunit C-terminal domain [Eubacteriales bacterium]
MISLAPEKLCTGCSACKYACPQGAIGMCASAEGFSYPQIDESACISCNKCQKSCPVLSKAQESNEAEYLAGRHTDDTVRGKSSSGGVFFALARHTVNSGGVVFAAGFDKDLRLCHRKAETADEIYPLMGSKYVESSIENVYEQIDSALKDQRPVLFVGTPCQTAGVRKIFGFHENLLLADFVCHGVPSRKLFEKYLCERKKGEIESINFRDKSMHPTGMQFTVNYRDKSKYSCPSQFDPYMLAFIQNISLRRSCTECRFKDKNFASDITLGDAWGIEKTQNPLRAEKDVSLIITRTQKGKDLINKLKKSNTLQVEDFSFEEAKVHNPSLVTPSAPNPLRDKYYGDIDRLTVSSLSKKYCGNSLSAKARRFLARIKK